MNNISYANFIRWIARFSGSILVAFTLFMGIGESIEAYNKNGASFSIPFDRLTLISFFFWGVGLAGLVLALWKEWKGGIISLFSFIIFICLVAFNPKPDVHFSNILFIFCIPSVLYLYYSYLKMEASPKSSNKQSKTQNQ